MRGMLLVLAIVAGGCGGEEYEAPSPFAENCATYCEAQDRYGCDGRPPNCFPACIEAAENGPHDGYEGVADLAACAACLPEYPTECGHTSGALNVRCERPCATTRAD